jgi:hypothetical protein
MIENRMLVNSRLYTQNNFSENYLKFCYAPQKAFAIRGQKCLFDIVLEMRQIIKLPGALTSFRLALVRF